VTLARARELIKDAHTRAEGHDDVQIRARLSLARVGLQNGEVDEATVHLRAALERAYGDVNVLARNAFQLMTTDGGRNE
jgi:thioredoxin-like negative regulator of GroEL